MRLADWPESSRHHSSRGVSVLELIIGLALMAMALTIVVPRLTTRPLHFTADLRELTANVEVAREFAQSRSVHYRVRVLTQTQYAIERGALVGSAWTFSAAERLVTLRPGVAFSAGAVGLAAEFDTRGRLVGADVTLTLADQTRGWSRQVRVRETGLVEVQ